MYSYNEQWFSKLGHPGSGCTIPNTLLVKSTASSKNLKTHSRFCAFCSHGQRTCMIPCPGQLFSDVVSEVRPRRYETCPPASSTKPQTETSLTDHSDSTYHQLVHRRPRSVEQVLLPSIMRPDGPRDEFAGPASGPEPPFPIKLSGPVIRGFGRGGKEVS